MTPGIDLSIVIPAYHEQGILACSLQQLEDFLQTRDFGKVEVLVVAQTPADVKAGQFKSKVADFRVLDLRQRAGKGGAVRQGMLAARGRFRLFMDADLATPLRHIDEAWSAMQDGADVGIAVRDLWRIHPEFSRALISKMANWVSQFVLVPGIKDTQCGFKIFTAEATEAVFNRLSLTNWSFDVELLAVARYLGLKIQTFQAPDWNDPKASAHGLSGDSALMIALREAKDPFAIRWRLWTGKYKEANKAEVNHVN